mmetsp:Transcript_4176/g.13357  ORF Transcript_4176/g.13357 Transcript_4176/m.13357 type:complete len:242 (-) Transcript_4176:483-1208(-)
MPSPSLVESIQTRGNPSDKDQQGNICVSSESDGVLRPHRLLLRLDRLDAGLRLGAPAHVHHDPGNVVHHEGRGRDADGVRHHLLRRSDGTRRTQRHLVAIRLALGLQSLLVFHNLVDNSVVLCCFRGQARTGKHELVDILDVRDAAGNVRNGRCCNGAELGLAHGVEGPLHRENHVACADEANGSTHGGALHKRDGKLGKLLQEVQDLRELQLDRGNLPLRQVCFRHQVFGVKPVAEELPL